MIHKVRLFAQKNSRAFSQWEQCGPDMLLSCCDCGLTHDLRFRVPTEANPKTGKRSVYMSVRQNKHHTKLIRAQRDYAKK